MRVHLIKKETIESYAKGNARSRGSLQDWLSKLKYADWNDPEDIQCTFNSDLLGNGSSRVVFDIGGNNYCMICKYWFGLTNVHLYVKWIGTHAEYNKLFKNGRQYTVDDF